MPRRITLSLYTLALMLAVVTVVASGFGALRLPLSLLWHDGDDALRQIWFNIRLPRVLLALVIGGSLARSSQRSLFSCSADSGTVRSPGCCWSASPLMRYAARRWACCRGSAMTPSYASSRYGEWAALARRSGQRCWRSPL